MKNKILLIGSGGHCKVVMDELLSNKEFEIAGLIDLKERVGDKVRGAPIIGTDIDLPRFFKAGIKNCFIAIGSIGNPRLRVSIYSKAKKAGLIFPNVISTNALVSSAATIGQGNYIATGVIINAGAKLGSNCIVNSGAIIEHDCTIGDFVHLSPGSILSGNVTVGDLTHIGTGCVVIQNLEIGSNVVVGAGSVVTKNIGKNTIAYGNPCQERRKNV